MWGNPPERPMIIGQTRLRASAAVTAGSARKTLEYIRIVIAYIVLMLLPGNFHDGAVESIWMSERVKATFAQTLVSTTRPAAARHSGQDLATAYCRSLCAGLSIVALESVKDIEAIHNFNS